jgi:CHAD domain-containing protein
MATTAARPLETLRNYATEFEAAILLCLDKPAKKPVHRLRTMTRRIEAQLILLAVLRVPKVHGQNALKARRLLKKIRRAAGEVRDLDVLADLVTAHTPPTARKEAEDLRQTLEQQRDKAAGELQKTLSKNRTKLAGTLESLLKLLDEAGTLTLTSTELSTLTLDWFAHNAPPPSENPESLHTIRKKAKIARYLAENAPKQARAPHKLATEFESLQQIGGEWHDWLILSSIASEEAGKSSPLTQAFTRRCQRTLASYRRHLAGSVPKAAERPRA